MEEDIVVALNEENNVIYYPLSYTAKCTLVYTLSFVTIHKPRPPRDM